ncbi:LysE family translocator [Croceimicrobium hydrocarbonivorans]|uniref:LysE family translocator n=1 Tax=Croceimicrobium hydrocarbonivorans TaxID=2761580 RepID=A0A7H0VH00_9FLAO|nr:LysE family translocator [Croceimicrobium hydrocarbonivorans]QNR24998.1 LysE family translocator [Croceimicrobium hydrocarbonivorans]
MNWELYFTFLSAAIALTFMPGPDNIFVLTESLSRGSRRGISLSAGLASGVLVHTLLAASGLALLLLEFPQISVALRLAGTLYLVYLAYGAWREEPQAIHLEKSKGTSLIPGFWSSWAKGFLMNVLNPKVTLFFLALLPQFVDSDAPWPAFQQMSFMGLSFMLQAFLIFSLMAILAGQFKRYLAKAAFGHFMKWLQVVVLLLIALGLWFL